MWCKGEVVGILKNNHVHVEWDKEYLRKGDKQITKQNFLQTYYNKHKEEAWRMNLDYVNVEK